MKLRLTPRAARDLADIGDYLSERSPGAALRGRDAILQSLQNLSLFPELGRKQ
jgi:plasmid stabilization system protein ParE